MPRLQIASSLRRAASVLGVAAALAARAARADPRPSAPPYPRQGLLRPRTLPGGMLELAPRVVASAELADEGAAMQVTYSPIDRLQLQATYPFALHPGKLATGTTLAIRHFTFPHPPHLFVATQVTVPIAFTGDALTHFTVAPPTKLLLSHTVGLFFGDDLFDVIVRPKAGLALNLPLGLGVQASDATFLQVSTTVARIAITRSATSPAGDRVQDLADRVPLAASALYAFGSRFDLVVAVGVPDARTAGARDLTVSAGVNVRPSL